MHLETPTSVFHDGAIATRCRLTWPQSGSRWSTRHTNGHFDVTRGEAELVPRLQHATAEVEVVVENLLHRND